MKKNSLGLVYVVNALFWSSIYAFVPVFPGYSSSIVSTAAMVGIISGSYGLMQLLLRIPLGILSDKLKLRKPFVLFGILCGFLCTIGMYFIPTGFGLLISRALSGVAACTYVQMTALYTSQAQAHNQKANMGMLTSTSAAGQVLAMLAGGVLGFFLGAKATFLLGAAMAVIAMVFALQLKDVPVQAEPVTVKKVLKALKSKPLLYASLLAVLSQCVMFGKSFTFSPLAADLMNATLIETSIITTLATIPQVLLSPTVGKVLMPKYGVKSITAIGFIIIMLSCAVGPWCKTVAMLCVSQLLTGLGNALVFPSLMSECIKEADESNCASMMGFFQAVYALGMFVGPWFTGWIVDIFNIDISFLSNAIIALFGAILTLILFSRKRVASQNMER